MTESTNDADLQRLKAAVDALSEHFSSVQVFTSRDTDANDGDPGDTIYYQWGSGNWHARNGQVREWLLYNEELVREKARADEDK